ncbi:MAG: hypothetical protein RSE12_17115 [Fuscovulum sp.]|nr:MAG: hypothetical protein RSE12_17115 [Fuscovulum sp.]
MGQISDNQIPAKAVNGRATVSRITKGDLSQNCFVDPCEPDCDTAGPAHTASRIKSVNVRKHREAPIQQAIVSYLRKVLPKGSVVHHNRNEIARSGKSFRNEIARAKSHGMVKGFPDLICIYPGGACFFEVKAEGNYADAAQKELHSGLKDIGHFVAVVRSIDDARQYLTEWGIPNKDPS